MVGLARSGVAAARALRERGERVIGVDAGRPDGLGELAQAGVELHTGEDGVALLGLVGTIVKSPGVPREAPVIAEALARKMPVLGELELGWRLLGNEVIAVTGTNGKTTTVEWIGHIHRAAGLPVAVAGNVGAALSGLVKRIDSKTTVVCEASSFQLEDADGFAPEAAVLLNISPDHLDRHGTVAAYLAVKLKIFEHQTADDIAVVPADLDIAIPGHARQVRWDAGDVKAWEIGLRGRHNVQNAMAAAAVCLARGVNIEAVREGLHTFKGVKHRLEEVARKEGVVYVNDSKATNVASTLVALDAYTPDAGTAKPTRTTEAPGATDSPYGRGGRIVHLILGGQGKGQDFSALRDPVKDSCKAVYTIGEDAESIAAALEGVDVQVKECGDLEHAVAAAKATARPGDVVLLSPACASYDQFKDYEARGERFRELLQ